MVSLWLASDNGHYRTALMTRPVLKSTFQMTQCSGCDVDVRLRHINQRNSSNAVIAMDDDVARENCKYLAHDNKRPFIGMWCREIFFRKRVIPIYLMAFATFNRRKISGQYLNNIIIIYYYYSVPIYTYLWVENIKWRDSNESNRTLLCILHRNYLHCVIFFEKK